MSSSFDPPPRPIAPFAPLAPIVPAEALAASMAARWREAATALRRLAAEVPRPAHDLAAFHRPDVWRGAVATRFGDDLEHWRSRLGSATGAAAGLDLAGELRAMSDRLDARAAAVDVDVSVTAADPSWWGWRGER